MSGNVLVSVYTRSNGSTTYPVSTKSTSRSIVPFGKMDWESDCEQLSFWYFCRSQHPQGGRGRIKNLITLDCVYILCSASSTSWVHARPSTMLKLLHASGRKLVRSRGHGYGCLHILILARIVLSFVSLPTWNALYTMEWKKCKAILRQQLRQNGNGASGNTKPRWLPFCYKR